MDTIDGPSGLARGEFITHGHTDKERQNERRDVAEDGNSLPYKPFKRFLFVLVKCLYKLPEALCISLRVRGQRQYRARLASRTKRPATGSPALTVIASAWLSSA